jgi:hypothetical protein
MPEENVSAAEDSMLVKPKPSRMDNKEGSSAALAVDEKSSVGDETSKKISVKTIRVETSFRFFSFFLEFSLLFLLNLTSAR